MHSKMRLKRRIKILFYVTVCSVIGISLFRQLLFVVGKINLKHFQHILSLEPDEFHYDVDEDWFSLWNFTAAVNRKPAFLATSHNETKWSPFIFKLFRKSNENSTIDDYMKRKKELCGGSFIGYANLFAVLSNVLVDPTKGTGKTGGEKIADVINQDEESEYYKLSKGYFSLNCPDVIDEPTYSFSARDHLVDWMSAVDFQSNYKTTKKRIKRVTISVQRYEYANLYHTMTDLYNVFLMYLIFGLESDMTNIFWLDGHPRGALDQTWRTLFGHVIRAGSIKKPIVFKTMIWNILGYYSLLNNHDLGSVPYLDEFRYFFLTRHGVKPYRQPNCSSVTVSFIWRRDYLAHPRNPEGCVQRKIKNEDELVTSLKTTFPKHKINGYQFDKFSMQEQLQIIAGTDIFIGMHGAGLTHALFLSQHATLVELFPAPGSFPRHFRSIAMWRGLKYVRWHHKNWGSPKGFTYVNPAAINAIVKELTSQMCPKPRNVPL